MSFGQLMWYVSIGFCCWLYSQLAPLALQFVSAGTFVPFSNVAIIMSFFFEIFYHGRIMFWSDYIGATLIIVGTAIQSNLAEKTTNSEVKTNAPESIEKEIFDDDDNYKRLVNKVE